MVDLYGGHLDEKGQLLQQPDMDRMHQDFWSISISDDQTRDTIKQVYEEYSLVLEPHGAVAWAGLQAYLADQPSELPCIAFETADPAKFPDQIRELIGIDPPLPEENGFAIYKRRILESNAR